MMETGSVSTRGKLVKDGMGQLKFYQFFYMDVDIKGLSEELVKVQGIDAIHNSSTL